MIKDMSQDCGYMLCASPRSGSTLLCDLLIQSGVAGSPKSFFRPGSVIDFAEEWGVQLTEQGWDETYVQAVRQHSNNGTACVGARIMWSGFEYFVKRLGQLYPYDENDRKRIFHALGIDHYIYLSRDDKVAQAVSLVIAKQTGLWHLNSDGSEKQRTKSHKQPVYDRQQIAEKLRMLEAETAGWEKWFKANKIEPLHITYEDMAANPIEVFDRVMDFIGRTVPPNLKVGTQKMATELNNEWSDRYRSEISGT